MKDFKALSRKEFDRQAHSVWGKVGYNSQNYQPMMAFLRSARPNRVLDLGCGGGAFLALAVEALPDAQLTGLDLSANMVEVARDRLGAHAEILQGDAEALPFPDDCFDAVTSNESFHHYPHVDVALKEVHRVLKPGGTLLLCDLWMSDQLRWLANWLFRRINTGDVHAYSESEILSFLDDAGFRKPQYRKISSNAFLCIAEKPIDGYQ